MSEVFDETTVEHRMIDGDGVKLHAVFAGPDDGHPVLLLHGFPELWYSWRHQIGPLAAAGLRVCAVDQRGYNLSDRPRGVDSYHIRRLVADVAAVADGLGGRVALVGHDWGGVVAWVTAMQHPERISRLAVCNLPHPARMREGYSPAGVLRAALGRRVPQLVKSWYVGAFQLPILPEALLRRRRFLALREMLRRDPCRPNAFTDADIARYVEAMGRPGALSAGIHWYRAAARAQADGSWPRMRRIDVPTLVIFGEQDRYLDAALAEPPAKLVPDCRVVRIPDASHWVMSDAPERVSAELVAFLTG